MQKYKYVFVAVIVAVIVLAIVFQDKLKNLAAKATAKKTPANTGGAAAAATGSAAVCTPFATANGTPDTNKLLKRGPGKSLENALLQLHLNDFPTLPADVKLCPDGAFGPATENALLMAYGKKEIKLSQLNGYAPPAEQGWWGDIADYFIPSF